MLEVGPHHNNNRKLALTISNNDDIAITPNFIAFAYDKLMECKKHSIYIQ